MSKLELGGIIVGGLIFHSLFIIAHISLIVLFFPGLILSGGLHLIYIFMRGGRWGQYRQNQLLREQNELLRGKKKKKKKK